jgi:putative membrane protein
MMGGWNMMGGMGWVSMLLGGLFWLFLLMLAIWGMLQLLYGPERTVAPDAAEILKRRYAHGEITREEFEEAQAALHS